VAYKELLIAVITGSFALLTALQSQIVKYYLDKRAASQFSDRKQSNDGKHRHVGYIRNIAIGVVCLALAIAAISYSSGQRHNFTIRISKIPNFIDKTDPSMKEIAGEVSGGSARSLSVVVYAYTDHWYVQPDPGAPFTAIDSSGKWTTQTRYGTEYLALLVRDSYHPSAQIDYRPGISPDVDAVTPPEQK